MIRWYVAATKPARERVAELHLRNQAFRVFLPLRKKSVRQARRMTTQRVPLFPGYLFVQLDIGTARWRSINGTIGVKRLIAQDERPVPLPDGFIDALVANLAPDGTFDYGSRLAVGDRVELVAGPFARQVGELSRLDDRGRVCVLLNLLSGVVPVRTRVDNLVPA